MNKIISKSGMSRLCIFSCILLCSVFSENTYGRPWKHDDMEINYYKKDRSFILTFLIYDFKTANLDEQSYALTCDILYSEDGEKYNSLIVLHNDEERGDDVQWSEIFMSTTQGKFQFPGCLKVEKRDSKTHVGSEIKETQHKNGRYLGQSKTAYISIKWCLPESIKTVHSFKYVSLWMIKSKYTRQYHLNEIYQMKQDKANSKVTQKANDDDNVKVTGGTDAIIVKGTEPGENIKVYSFSGVELKSVVAKGDAVNIQLPKNQNYIINAGQKGYKVAL